MRPFIFLVIIGCSLLTCKKKDDDLARTPWGTVSAIKNAEIWEGEIYALSKAFSFSAGGGLDIIIDTDHEIDCNRESLHLFKVPAEVGKYLFSKTTFLDMDGLTGAVSMTCAGGDVFGILYKLILDDSIEDYVEITEIDKKEIKGKFGLSLVIESSEGNNTFLPDTIIYKNGVFHTKIID